MSIMCISIHHVPSSSYCSFSSSFFYFHPFSLLTFYNYLFTLSIRNSLLCPCFSPPPTLVSQLCVFQKCLGGVSAPKLPMSSSLPSGILIGERRGTMRQTPRRVEGRSGERAGTPQLPGAAAVNLSCMNCVDTHRDYSMFCRGNK